MTQLKQAIDVLIEWKPKGGGFHIEPAPGETEVFNLGTLLSRFRSMHPMKPDAAKRYIAKIYETGTKPDLVYAMGYGACLVADRIKKIFDDFDCSKLEFIPVNAFKVGNENQSLEPGIRGKKIDEQYWIMNCFDFYDVINPEQSVGKWQHHRPYDLENSPHYYGLNDPAELFNPENIALSSVPNDAIFAIVGLSRKRFVSEALFERFYVSGLFDQRWELPFRLFNLVAAEQGLGGNARSIPEQERRPHLLNGRTLYWGNLRQPLDFPQHESYG